MVLSIPIVKEGAPVARVPARVTRFALGAVLLSLVMGASPAFAAQRTATGNDSRDDGIAGSTRDIVSTSFDYDDSGAIALRVTMAAPIDPQNARSTVTWSLSEVTGGRDCDESNPSPTAFSITYDTAGEGHFLYGTGEAQTRRPLTGSAQIDGATLVYTLSDPKLAGHEYSCLVVAVAATRGDSASTSTDAPGDKAAAIVTGFTGGGPFVYLREAGKSVEATDSGVVRLSFDSSAYDKPEGVVNLRTARKVRLQRSKPPRVLKLGAADVNLSQYGKKTTGKVRLTKDGRAFLNRANRVAVVATIVAKDAQGRKSTAVERFTLESAPE